MTLTLLGIFISLALTCIIGVLINHVESITVWRFENIFIIFRGEWIVVRFDPFDNCFRLYCDAIEIVP